MGIEMIAGAVALAVAAMMSLVVLGFLPILLRPYGPVVHHLSAGIVLLLTAVALRSIYWDLMPVMGFENAFHPVPIILFGAIMLRAGYHLLRVQLLLIPEFDRGQYSIWTAPFYPRRLALIRGMNALRRAWRKEHDNADR